MTNKRYGVLNWISRVLPGLQGKTVKPKESNFVEEAHACPRCGERDADRLVWQDEELVRCESCGRSCEPGGCQR